MSLDRERISFRELWSDFCSYSWKALSSDLTAGLNVALLAIPQGMAYSMVAGLPVISGLVTAIVAVTVASIFSSSRYLIMGPTNVTALIVGIGVSDVIYTNFRYIPVEQVPLVTIQLVVLVTLLAGVMQVIAGLCRLGRLTQLVSHSVAVGYMAGVVIAVYASQSFDLLGMDLHVKGASLLNRFYYLFEHIQSIHLPTTALGSSCIVILLVLRRFLPSCCPALFMLGIASFVTYYFGLGEQGIALVSDSGAVSFSDWEKPPFLMTLELANDLLPTAFAVAALSMLDSTAVGKTLAAKSGRPLSNSQELLALGLANIASSIVGGMPSSASPSRSFSNYVNGAKTRLAAVFSSLFITVVIAVGAPAVEMVPITALAAVILVSASHLLDFSQARLCFKATSADRYVLIATVVCCILFSLQTAFYLGVGISIVLFLQQTAKPQLKNCEVHYRRSWRSGVCNRTEDLYRYIQVVQVDNELFFGAADLFQDAIKSATEKDSKVLILVMRNNNSLDATACLAIQQLYEYLSRTERHLILCGVTPKVWGVLERSGLAEILGRGNLFALNDRPRRSVDYALERAVTILDREGAADCQSSPLLKRSIKPKEYQLSLHEFMPKTRRS